MKWTSMLNFSKWTAMFVSVWTMTFAPVALGQESQRISEEKLIQGVRALGLNKSMTLGQFWDQNKYLMPERLQNQIEPYVKLNRNQKMPTFEVVAGKTTSGESIPTLRVSGGNELINLQWFGENSKYLKFQNTTLSEVDMINFSDMYTRIVAGDEKFRKQIEERPVNRLDQKFNYPDINESQWKSMSNIAKAEYILNLRILWQDAREVLNSKATTKKNKPKKTSSYFFDKNQHFFELFGSALAEASQTNYLTAKSCVVAGYISRYEKINGVEVCSVNYVRQQYSQRTADPKENLYNLAQERIAGGAPGCNSSSLACNPYIYGAPGGNPICVTPTRTDANFQKATHFDGPCDTQSRLQTASTPLEFIKPECLNKSQGRYAPECLSKTPAQIEDELKKDAGTKKLTEDFLLGILKLQGKSNETDFSKLNLQDDKIRKTLMDTKQKFVDEINAAKEACAGVSRDGGGVERNFWPACDQLYRRFLFIDLAIKENCEENGQIPNPAAGGCSCPATNPPPSVVTNPPATSQTTTVTPVPPAPVTPAPNTGAPVAPSAMCSNPHIHPAPVPPPPANPPVPPTPVDQCQLDIDGVVINGPNCLCAGGNKPNGTTCRTNPDDDSRPPKPDKKDECGILCKVWNGVKVVAPFAVAGLAAYFLFKWMAPKKPTLAAPPDRCPNGSIPPCAQTCTPPLKLQPTGLCSCDGCPPGQSPDATCTCRSGGGTNPTTILCPDSVTRAASLDACPDYPCWNGQSYKNPMNCPPAPASPSAAPSGVAN